METDSHRLAGFFALSAGSVSCSDLPESLAKKLPRYPVPMALIGRLAVAQEFQGKGLGSILLQLPATVTLWSSDNARGGTLVVSDPSGP